MTRLPESDEPIVEFKSPITIGTSYLYVPRYKHQPELE